MNRLMMIWAVILLAAVLGMACLGYQASPASTLPVMREVSFLSMGTLDAVSWKFLPFHTTAVNPVTGWFNVETGQMYDKTNNVLADAPTWTNCVTSISRNSVTGLYQDTPESTMPAGFYAWRLWDSASPASTDAVLKGYFVYWDGNLITKIGEM